MSDDWRAGSPQASPVPDRFARVAPAAGLALFAALLFAAPEGTGPSPLAIWSQWLPPALALAALGAAALPSPLRIAAALPALLIALWLAAIAPDGLALPLRLLAVLSAVGALAGCGVPRGAAGAWTAAVAGAALVVATLFLGVAVGAALLRPASAAAADLALVFLALFGVALMAPLTRRPGSGGLTDGCAAALVGLGALGLVGALLELPELTAATRSLPLRLQTALVLLLCGLALARLGRSRDRLAPAALAGALALTVAALLGGGGEQATANAAAVQRLNEPLPVATSAALLLAIVGMLLARLAPQRPRLMTLAWLIGLAVLALALLVLVGHVLDLREVRSLPLGATTSPAAALGLLLLGLGLSTLDSGDARLHSRRQAWLPAAAAFAGLLLSIGLWDAARDQERNFRAATEEAAAEDVERAIETGLANRVRAFQRVSQRLVRRPEPVRLEGLADDLGDYLDASSRLSLAAYFDGDLQLRSYASVLPDEETEALLAIHRDQIDVVLSAAAQSLEPTLGEALLRPAREYVAFLAVPLVADARADGFLLLKLRLGEFIAGMLAFVEAGTALRVESDGRLLFAQGASTETEIVREARFLGRPWRIAYAPPPQDRAVRTSTLILGGGLLATLLLAIALRKSALARMRTQQAEHSLATKRRIVDSSPDVIGSLDADGRFLEVNAASERVWDFTPEELTGSHYVDLVDPAERERVQEELRAAQRGQPLPPSSHDCLARGGQRVVVEWSVNPLPGSDRLVFVCRDMTESRRIEAELDRMLTHDRVTGLLRHASFEQALQAEIEAGAASIAVYFINLDHFHGVNESMGRDAGDSALREVASRLQGLGGGLRVARYAGDEFGAYAAGLDGHAARALAERVREAVARPVEGEGFRIFLTASIGMSRYPRDGASAGDLIRRAELAMKQVKNEGRDQVAVFSLEHMRELEERLTLGARLRAAVERGELRLHYQPQVDARSGRATGFEALLRWHSPGLGTVSPARFVPVAESLGLMPELGRWVLDEACRQAREWRDRGRNGFTISVNVSALQIQRPDFVDQVQMALVRHRLPGSAIDLELTESALMENLSRVQSTLSALKALGVSLSLDDFGTGYSSLAYLRQFKLDKLKIDRSFVADLPAAEDAAVIARTIIAVAHQLRMRVAAEGVETAAQRRFLVESGCDELQGYLCGRPQPASECEGILGAGGAESLGSSPGIA